MPQFTRNSYIPYQHSHLIHDWAALLEEDRDTVVAIAASWDSALKENKRLQKVIHEECQQEIQEVANMLEDHGSQVYKRNRNGKIEKKTSFYAWFDKNVADSIRGQYALCPPRLPVSYATEQEVDGLTLKIQHRSLNLVEMFDTLTQQYASLKAVFYKKHALYQASLEYAAEHDINIEELSEKDILWTVSLHAKEQYRHDNLPEGMPIYFDECDYCEEYSVGDRRCPCGNRRVVIDIDGNILDGFEHWARAY